MKSLHSLRLIQFYLFEKEDLPISAISGVFGPNGSGKSALIDAMQIVMTGAHHQFTAFNAQADETRTTSRSLRSYCLGQTGEASAGGVRESATTYLTMIWKDDQTGEPTSMGLCITASASTEKHQVEGRYLLPGVELTLEDHLETSGTKQRPQDWKTFRKELDRQAKAVGYEGEVVFNEPMRFVRAYLTALRGSGAIPQADSFLRAFRFGLKMRFDRPVDEIIRYQMLESRPTQVRNFRQVLDSVRNLRNRVVEIEEKIHDAEHVIRHYNEASKRESQVATWAALAGKGRMLMMERSVIVAREKLEESEKDFSTISELKDECKRNIEEAEIKEKHYSQLMLDHSAHQESKENQQLIGILKESKEKSQATIVDKVTSIRECIRVLADHPELSSGIGEAEAVHDQLVEILLSPTLPEIANIQQIASTALNLIATAHQGVTKELLRLKRDLDDRQSELRQLKDNLQRVKSGKTALSPSVLHLQRVLEDNGIRCTPVCDIVSVSDSSWQPAIEAYLKPHLEALLVEEHEDRAFALYRQQQNIYGVKLVRESRHRSPMIPVKGSVAELLEGSHPAAVDYLRSQFGKTMRAESDESALSGERTLTRDGMLTGKTIDRLRPAVPGTFLLGRDNRTAQHDELLGMENRLQKEIESIITQSDRWQDYSNRFAKVSNPEAYIRELEEHLESFTRTQERLDSTRHKFIDGTDKEYISLCDQKSEWALRLHELRKEQLYTLEQFGSAKSNVQRFIDALETIQEQHSSSQERLTALLGNPAYDPEFAKTQWFELVEIQKLSPNAAAEVSEKSKSKAFSEQSSLLEKGRGDFEKFIMKHSMSPPDEIEHWHKLHIWLRNYIEVLKASELADYKEQMEAAFRAAQETFRNDVALAIDGNIDWLRSVMDRLNKVLENAPAFSNGEYYRFIRNERPEHTDLLRFIRDVKQLGPQDDMFGAGDMPAAFRDLLDDNTAVSGATRGPLDDYREFFDFDIEIYRKDPEKRRINLGRLSRRIGTGSGGEHRAPLYVIAGAALASAYHLSPSHRDGLALIVLDEAFNKMDPGNIISTMQYFSELGLQVVMASPGENLGTLTAFLYSYFDIIRDADTNVVKLSYREVTEATRDLFRSDLLEFHPELLAREIEAMQSSRGGTSEGVAT